MPTFSSTAIVAVAAAAIAFTFAPPAHAGPNDGPCGAGFNPWCLAIPVLPNLDHDVDLTTGGGALTSDTAAVPSPLLVSPGR